MSLQGAIVKNLLLIYVILGLSVSSPATAQDDFKRASICEVLADTGKHHLHHVSIDADLFIVRPDGVALFDKRCPEKALGLDFPARGEEESVANLDKLLRNGEWPMESTGTFRGKIIRHSNSKRPFLLLSSVLNLQPKSGPTLPPDVIVPIPTGKPPQP
jgi:hypothetical protein